jgi:ATPase family protein associated with various cellular activities (AAA)/winged helix domain-containing protein
MGAPSVTPATDPPADLDLTALTSAVHTLREVLRGRRPTGLPVDSPPSLARIEARFGLTPFEASLLLLCAGVELDPELARWCGEARGYDGGALPTFGLAASALPGPHWSAIGPEGPLRRWRMVEIGPGDVLADSSLRISERVLLQLVGAPQLDHQLVPFVQAILPAVGPDALAASQRQVAEQIAAVWADRREERSVPLIRLRGGTADDRRAVVVAACALAGRGPADLETLSRLWEREAALSDRALLIAADTSPAETGRHDPVARFAGSTGGFVVAGGDQGAHVGAREVVFLDVPAPTVTEQRAAWTAGLPPHEPDDLVDRLISQFSLGPAAIRAVCAEVATVAAAGDAPPGPGAWEICVRRSRPRLDGLAAPVTATATWDDLVLPEPQTRALRAIVRHVRYRARVQHGWGFGDRGTGLGVSALFTGGSGTGKTMAAELLATELGLGLYRVDLSGVVSKYIGETEKNLGRVFDAAEASGAILLFDEADALFGKRSEVRDSHDRYANIEVSYLLQRMESYGGLAILTTNLADAIDQAFLRRLRFVVRFPFPDAEQRAELWRRAFPGKTPTEGLDPAKLATLQATGGNIRNIALGAAYHAAEAGSPVGMAHVLAAALDESEKSQRPLSPAELQGWA